MAVVGNRITHTRGDPVVNVTNYTASRGVPIPGSSAVLDAPIIVPGEYDATISAITALVGRWKIDDTSGIVVAATVGTNGAYSSGVNPTPTLGVTGLVLDGGTAATTDGSGSEIQIPYQTGQTSIAWWTQHVTGGAGGTPMMRDATSTAGVGWFLDISGTNPIVRADGTSHTVTSVDASGLRYTGAKHFYVIQTDGTTVGFFIDGAQVDSWAKTGTFPTGAPSWHFGRNGTAAQYYGGTFDEIAIFNALLTPTQVTNLWQTGITATAFKSAAIAFTATATLTSAATEEQFATASFTATATLSTAGTRVQPGTAAFSATSTFTAAGVRETFATAAFSATSTFTAAGTREQPGAVAFTATSTLTAAAIRETFAAVVFSGVSTFTAAAIREAFGVVAFSATSTFTAAGTRVQFGVVPFSATSTFAIDASGAVTADVAFTAVSTLSTAGTREQLGAVVFSATSTLSPTAIRVLVAIATFTASSSLNIVGTIEKLAAKIFAATSTLTVTGTIVTSNLNLPVDPSRIYVITGERRVLVVAGEQRVLVATDSRRIMMVGAETRTYPVPFEERILRARALIGAP